MTFFLCERLNIEIKLALRVDPKKDAGLHIPTSVIFLIEINNSKEEKKHKQKVLKMKKRVAQKMYF